MGKLITFMSFVYILYLAMKERGYWDELKTKMGEAKDKMKDKYNNWNDEESWYTMDAEEILRQRFASGEIDEDEFKMRMNALKR